MIKGRVDAVTEKRDIIDLKTTSSLLNFEKDIVRYEYYIQAAMYYDLLTYRYKNDRFSIELFTDRTYYILALEKEPPYECCMFEISKEKLEQSREIYKNRIKLIRDSKDMPFCEYYGGKQKIIRI